MNSLIWRQIFDILDDYIMTAHLTGQAFTINAAEVHTFIVSIIMQNNEAESNNKIFEDTWNGQNDWTVLKIHCEDQGIYSNKYIQGRCRSKEPLLWWQEETPYVVDWILA